MTSQSSIVKKMGTFHDEMIHIMHGCATHLHGHWNKMVSLMKLSILVNFNNGAYWSTNDIRNHHLMHWVNNHDIDNEDLVLSSHVRIDL
jgi:hypothetical protein